MFFSAKAAGTFSMAMRSALCWVGGSCRTTLTRTEPTRTSRSSTSLRRPSPLSCSDPSRRKRACSLRSECLLHFRFSSLPINYPPASKGSREVENLTEIKNYIPHVCNGWKVWSNGTTSVPKSVPRLVLDKVRQVIKSEVLISHSFSPSSFLSVRIIMISQTVYDEPTKTWSEYTTTQHMKSWLKYTKD